MMETDPPKKVPWEQEALLIKDRVDELEHQSSQDKKRDADYKSRQLTYNFVLTIATIGLFLVSVWQGYLATRATNSAEKSAEAAQRAAESSDRTSVSVLKQMEGQSKAMKDAASAALTQAQNGKAALELAVDQFRTQQRALVITSTPSMNQASNGVVWHIQNHGKLTATRIVSNANLVVDQNRISSIQEKMCKDISAQNYFREILTPEQIGRPRTAFAEDAATSFLVGCIKYADKFSSERWTRFCFEPYVRQPGTFIACFGNNSTDAD